jgi:hypothetical protein
MPKWEHTTLPSVGMWGSNMNILRDPPKAVFTRRRDKVGETSEITKWIGEDSGDRICEAIKVYPRGIDPMKNVQYGNYGTSGGQVRLQAGNVNTNFGVQGSSFARSQQASLPYRIVRDGAFRPPVLPPQDLLPLSRLPRTWTYAFTNPEFPNFAKRMDCPENPWEVKKEVITTCIRPTAVYNIETPHEKPYEVKNVIQNPVQVSAHSGVRTIDNTMLDVQQPTRGIQDIEHYNMTANYGSEATTRRVENHGNNAERFVQDIAHTSVTAQPSQNINVTPLENLTDIEIVLKDPLHVSHQSALSGQNSENYIHEDMELDRKLPVYNTHTNMTQNIYKRNVKSKDLELQRNMPQTSYSSNPGDLRQDHNSDIGSRNYKIAPRLHRGGFGNSGRQPKTTHIDNNYGNIDPLKARLQKEAYRQWEDRNSVVN